MAFSLNKIMLIGNIGKDPETRFTQNQNSVTSFGVATTNSYKNRDGNWTEETTWHNIVAWSLSDYMKDTLKKGAKVYVEGRLTKRDYTDKENIKRYITEVVAEKIIPLDARGGGDSQRGASQDSYSGEAPPAAASDDDLPF